MPEGGAGVNRRSGRGGGLILLLLREAEKGPGSGLSPLSFSAKRAKRRRDRGAASAGAVSAVLEGGEGGGAQVRVGIAQLLDERPARQAIGAAPLGRRERGGRRARRW